VYNNPKLKKVIGNKYKLKALNMLSKNMIVHRVVTGAGKRIICIKEGKKKKGVSLIVTLSATNSFNIINA
jgi:hypothetical protein